MTESTKVLQVGDQAPDFVLPNDQGEAVQLSKLQDRFVILFWMHG